MADLARSTGITLAGGDTTSGPLSITITAMGLVESGQALTRDGARDGDLVAVSGYLGDAAHALATLRSGEIPDPVSRAALECPEPRLQLGRRLRGLATSCIDISDGLVADIGHILEASSAGAEIELERLPCSDQLAGLPGKQKWELQTAGGDDYELCFTLPENRQDELDTIARESDCQLTIIGKINSSGALVCRMADGTEYIPRAHGYDHFSGKTDQ
jgi:thiamine-monophosphate kinase